MSFLDDLRRVQATDAISRVVTLTRVHPGGEKRKLKLSAICGERALHEFLDGLLVFSDAARETAVPLTALWKAIASFLVLNNDCAFQLVDIEVGPKETNESTGINNMPATIYVTPMATAEQHHQQQQQQRQQQQVRLPNVWHLTGW